ncbi:hypothetical protein Osc7112_2752 [Oscillatoria nigro-viridis PCC 7112]|uniref:Uncharacterized protein n=1 Tax=Phormidium nigroviride PCC 7112 TaxID=179408 RepID=K9VI47_9CYAN|nr:hypothetical protein Osc7112_2752 [Oscillatoria nigro-viridis PCC 7112]
MGGVGAGLHNFWMGVEYLGEPAPTGLIGTLFNH